MSKEMILLRNNMILGKQLLLQMIFGTLLTSKNPFA